MAIKENLIALRDTIKQHFPKQKESYTWQKRQAIQIMQESLAEVLLQIERILARKPLPENFESSNDEQKEYLINLANFFLALSLSGKIRISSGLAYNTDLIDQEVYDSLNPVLSSIYHAIAYLNPHIELSDNIYEEGSSQTFPCHDLKTKVRRSFQAGLITRIDGDEDYIGEIQEIVRGLDKNYQSAHYDPAQLRTPLHSSAVSSSSSSSTKPPYNANLSPETSKMFRGLFSAVEKKSPLEQAPTPTKISRTNSSENGSSKRILSVVLTRGMFPDLHPKKVFLVKTEDSQPYTYRKHT